MARPRRIFTNKKRNKNCRMCLFYTLKESANRKCKLRFSGVEFNGERNQKIYFSM